jgi:hypothetical protein
MTVTYDRRKKTLKEIKVGDVIYILYERNENLNSSPFPDSIMKNYTVPVQQKLSRQGFVKLVVDKVNPLYIEAVSEINAGATFNLVETDNFYDSAQDAAIDFVAKLQGPSSFTKEHPVEDEYNPEQFKEMVNIAMKGMTKIFEALQGELS